MAETRKRIVWVAERFRGRIVPVIVFSLTFDLLALIVLAPLSSGLLSLFLHRWGRCSVGNFELVSFFFSPIGMAAVVIVGTVVVAAIYVELAGVLLACSARCWDISAVWARWR